MRARIVNYDRLLKTWDCSDKCVYLGKKKKKTATRNLGKEKILLPLLLTKDEFLALLQKRIEEILMLLQKAKVGALLAVIAIDRGRKTRDLDMIFSNGLSDLLGMELLEL